MTLDLDAFEILSFDCYGTLVDWEAGIVAALAPVLARHGLSVPEPELLEAYASLEAGQERMEPFRPYGRVLREVVDRLGRRFGFTASDTERSVLADSIGRWPPFPDTREALRALRKRYRLAIISNVDDDLFAETARTLGVSFDWIVTAQQAGSYKPSLANFNLALARLAAPREKILHVAQSLYHDIEPATRLGLATVRIDRRRGRPGSGATPPAEARADLDLPDLRSLATLAGLA